MSAENQNPEQQSVARDENSRLQKDLRLHQAEQEMQNENLRELQKTSKRPAKPTIIAMKMRPLAQLRQHRNLTPPVKCPIIELTADAETQTKTDCLEAGCDDILIKPLSTSALLQCLKRIL